MKKLIYHYTSIQTLELIITNKTLRLNGLSNVDDMEEGYDEWFGEMSKYAFVSSWTEDDRENIPLWNLYTPNMTGVRIGIDPSKITLDHGQHNEVENIENADNILAYANSKFPVEVTYTKKGLSEMISPEGGIGRKQIETLGCYKKESWEFQGETRFVLFAIPPSSMLPIPIISRKNLFYESLLHKVPTAINYIDLKLNDDVWDGAEILLGPHSTDADYSTVKNLTTQHMPLSKIDITKSSLRSRKKEHA
jgi:hypothetical protein